jgi:hypothetical protein
MGVKRGDSLKGGSIGGREGKREKGEGERGVNILRAWFGMNFCANRVYFFGFVFWGVVNCCCVFLILVYNYEGEM